VGAVEATHCIVDKSKTGILIAPGDTHRAGIALGFHTRAESGSRPVAPRTAFARKDPRISQAEATTRANVRFQLTGLSQDTAKLTFHKALRARW
jgi:hypothetical protein